MATIFELGQKWELEANKKACRGRVELGIRLLDKLVTLVIVNVPE